MDEFGTIHRIIETEKEKLIGLGRAIHQNPEPGDREFFAVKILCGYLESRNAWSASRTASASGSKKKAGWRSRMTTPGRATGCSRGRS